jgi:hypothetical protein
MPLFPFQEQRPLSDIRKVRWGFTLAIAGSAALPLLPRVPPSELNLTAFFLGGFVATLLSAALNSIEVSAERAKPIRVIATVFSFLLVAGLKAPSMPFPSSAAPQFVAGAIAVAAVLLTERMRSIMNPGVLATSSIAGDGVRRDEPTMMVKPRTE